MAAWSAQGYHIQHWYQLIADTQIDLYKATARGLSALHARDGRRCAGRCCCRCTTRGPSRFTCAGAPRWRAAIARQRRATRRERPGRGPRVRPIDCAAGRGWGARHGRAALWPASSTWPSAHAEAARLGDPRRRRDRRAPAGAIPGRRALGPGAIARRHRRRRRRRDLDARQRRPRAASPWRACWLPGSRECGLVDLELAAQDHQPPAAAALCSTGAARRGSPCSRGRTGNWCGRCSSRCPAAMRVRHHQRQFVDRVRARHAVEVKGRSRSC